MGLFSNRGRANSSDDFFDRLMRNQERLQRSHNYRFYYALKETFLYLDLPEGDFYRNTEYARALILYTIDVAKGAHVRFPRRYRRLPVFFVSNKAATRYGYVVVLPDVRSECECNFVAMMIENGERAFYTNEFYEDDCTFSVGKFTVGGQHRFGLGSAITLDDFKRVILGGDK